MRRRYLACLFGIAAVLGVPLCAAQSISESSFQEFHPQLLGSGGTYVGRHDGLPVLFTNPALLSAIPVTVTYMNLNSWMYGGIADIFPAFLQLLSGETAAGGAPGLARALESGGMGVGTSVITGVYGGNFSAVVSLVSDFFFYGDTYPNELFGTITHDVRLSLSVATPMIGDDVARFSIGATVEPFYRVSIFLPSAQTLSFLQTLVREPATGGTSYTDPENTLYGSGVSFHAGVRLLLADQFTIQFSMRDIGDTPLSYSRTSLSVLIDRLSVFSLPPLARVGDTDYASENTWTLPTKARFGIAYHPRWGEETIIEPVFSAEISEQIFQLEGNSAFNVLEALHFGAEVTFNQSFTLQTGLSQGQLTFGTGFDFGIFELHSAWFGLVRDLPNRRVTSHGLIISLQFNNNPPDS